jgi:mono/diheme cytochrome c family protein
MRLTLVMGEVVSCVVLFAACGVEPKSTSQPTAYEKASLTRGARLYDNWMKEKRVTPQGPNPGYALTPGKVTNVASTWRCNECHGWDYRGATGVYGSGSHYTGVVGVLHAKEDEADELFEVIKNGIEGKAMTSFVEQQHADADVWDLVKFIKEGTLDLSALIDSSGKPVGADVAVGKTLFEQGLPGTDPGATCAACHGTDGKRVNFHTAPQSPEFLGTVAQGNPWQFQHYVRFGYAGGPVMPAFNERGWTMQNVLDVLAYVQTLPVD